MKSPEAVIPESVSGPVPVLDTVTVCPRLVVPTRSAPKTRLADERDTVPTTPRPLRGSVCGLPTASSVIVSVPEAKSPAVTGLNVTSKEQLAPDARVGPQLLVWENPAVIEMPEMFTLFGSLLLRVTVRVEIVPM